MFKNYFTSKKIKKQAFLVGDKRPFTKGIRRT